MKYFLWRLLKRRFWIKLNSHYSRIIQGPKISATRYYYEEWKQRKNKIRNHELFEFVSKSSEGPVLSNRNPAR